MNFLRYALLTGVVLVSTAAAAQGLPSLDDDLDLDTIRQELQDAEAESALYSGGLIKTMIDMRIATLKSAIAMGYLQKYQEAGIRQVDASGKTSEPIPEVKKSEIALFCGDKYSDAVLLLDEENKTVTHSYFSDKKKYTQTATEYTWVGDYDELEGAPHQCRVDRYSLALGCVSPDETTYEKAPTRCTLVTNEPIPTTGAFAIECRDPKEKSTDVYRMDFDTGIAVDDRLREWSLKADYSMYLRLSMPPAEDGKITYCSVNRYTGRYGCEEDSKPEDVHPFAALFGSERTCKIVQPRI